MQVWRKGRHAVLEQRDRDAARLMDVIATLEQPNVPLRMQGTAVYLTKQSDIVPAALALNVRHNGVVHRQVVLLKVATERIPRVSKNARATVEAKAAGFFVVQLTFGFAEKPDVMAALRSHREAVGFDPDEASIFIGRETPVPSMRPDLSPSQEALFGLMTRNSTTASDYFLIPPQRVVEMGTRIELRAL